MAVGTADACFSLFRIRQPSDRLFIFERRRLFKISPRVNLFHRSFGRLWILIGHQILFARNGAFVFIFENSKSKILIFCFSEFFVRRVILAHLFFARVRRLRLAQSSQAFGATSCNKWSGFSSCGLKSGTVLKFGVELRVS